MILVDTSVWVDHLRKGDPQLSYLLRTGVVLTHPFVIGELACGNLGNRAKILSLLSALPAATHARHAEVMRLVEDREFWGSGIGWIDAHLVAAALLSHSSLWTNDRSLHAIAQKLEIAP